ncbi:MAG: sulfatase-like hydrolase/transferase [Ruminococcus sp.]|nr:sulfatase-like hydrolase/transferase [Candidatus Copronaster equi]
MIFDKSKKIFPLITAVIGVLIFVAIFVMRLNLVSIVAVAYMCIMSALIILSLIIKKKVYLGNVIGYGASGLGIILYYIIFGADSGWGAFTNGLAGFKSEKNILFTHWSSAPVRIAGNIILAAPWLIVLALLIVSVLKKNRTKRILPMVLSVILAATTVLYVLTMNLRSAPNTERMWEGHDDYLKGVGQYKTDSPNVLFILMDDMGWGDISANGAIFDTPNFDRICNEGVSFDNFYSSYSVCSPARFAAMTGRYPFRGFADNVMYPTVNCVSPLASTRLFNSIEMGANCDGMLGDEITIAEVFQNAGYDTACFGKWHLGDYGEYLPTNQGFDYFYGSHYVNDMKPFYHVKEENGDYEIVHGTKELKDQSKATEWINKEMFSWLDEELKSENPFFVYYSSPWPHAPVYAGDSFDGKSGMGTYVDCITEVDYYLGLLFDKLEKAGELDDTIIVFTSDNGPALEGSTGELRGGKYLAYEGGQKVPFAIRWGNNSGIWKAGSTRSQSATLVDLFPTLIDLCKISGGDKESYLPADRKIDGISMLPVLKNDTVIHTSEYPILYMKREKLKAIQYTVPTSDILSREEYKNYNYSVLKDNKYIDFKYFQRIQNDNSAFFDKYRKNWLHILSDDAGENYNRTPVYPTVSKEMSSKMDSIMSDFKANRRGMVR